MSHFCGCWEKKVKPARCSSSLLLYGLELALQGKRQAFKGRFTKGAMSLERSPELVASGSISTFLAWPLFSTNFSAPYFFPKIWLLLKSSGGLKLLTVALMEQIKKQSSVFLIVSSLLLFFRTMIFSGRISIRSWWIRHFWPWIRTLANFLILK